MSCHFSNDSCRIQNLTVVCKQGWRINKYLIFIQNFHLNAVAARCRLERRLLRDTGGHLRRRASVQRQSVRRGAAARRRHGQSISIESRRATPGECAGRRRRSHVRVTFFAFFWKNAKICIKFCSSVLNSLQYYVLEARCLCPPNYIGVYLILLHK